MIIFLDSTDVDSTLTVEGKVADAKAVGELLKKKLNIPDTAKVGQAVVVKAVDKDGKPIEFDVVDMDFEGLKEADEKIANSIETLSGKCASLEENKSNVLVHTESGETLALTDSVESKLFGLSLRGKSEQNGTPTPDNPQEIVSVGNSGSVGVHIDDQSITINTPNGLLGIKVTDPNLATYTDESGQMWCADEIDFERGVYVRNLVEIELTGSEEWISTGTHEFRTNSFSNVLPRAESDGILCTHYRKVTSGDRFKHGTIIRGIQGQQIFVCDNRFNNNIDAFVEFLANEKANGNPVVCYCRSSNSIETPLTADELEAYKALHTNYPTTTVMNDCGADMEVEYVADPANHISQNYVPKASYTELEARVSALERLAVNS